MRRTSTEKQWVFNKKGNLAGVAMGSDFCAEHEWGVARMKREFGCDDTKDGVERRTITKLPEDLQLLEEKTYKAIFLSPRGDYYKQPKDWVKTTLARSREEPFTAAWDEKTFGLVAWGEKDQKHLKMLWAAFQRLDIAFWPSIGVFHQGAGLVFSIPSQVPEEDKQTMLEADLDRKKLEAAADATGIAEKLEAAGRRYFALSPRWMFKDRAASSKHPVIFWLNPYDQDRYNAGWFTVEELEQWIVGKGPVPKEKR